MPVLKICLHASFLIDNSSGFKTFRKKPEKLILAKYLFCIFEYTSYFTFTTSMRCFDCVLLLSI